MNIQVLSCEDGSNKDKGDLLEKIAAEFLKTQGYNISTNIRNTGSELDLLCTHKVNFKKIYVECKAQKENLSANIIKNLLGTIQVHDYSEGWLISTGELTKDAKGLIDMWSKKPSQEREKLTIYTPQKVIKAFCDSKIICSEPLSLANDLIKKTSYSLGDWLLLISQWGKYWACPVLQNGVSIFVALFSTEKGELITDKILFDNLKSTDFIFNEQEFFLKTNTDSQVEMKTTAVVPVEYGEKLFDYRPARPENFVGRKRAQKDILSFFADVKKRRTNTRIFAIKGDSGIGKSSLIAKIRDLAQQSQKPKNLFLYAVDVRAANDATYIYSALIETFKKAAEKGFGTSQKIEITNYTDPLKSKSVELFLEECKRKRELIILVFDQFEELYSKPDLFSVFKEVKKLMFSVISASSSLVLGFAWKSDSTVPQDHPAYHMWHELEDHRYSTMLTQFSHADAEHLLKLFEAEINDKLLPELRKYLLENSQGLPWLLKKLCIHIYEQLENGTNQHQLANRSLDISSLFDRDLSSLSDTESVCLKLVAQNAPIDYCEVLESAGHDVVKSLQDKRLLIKRGDKLNLYWDIFRDYVLLGSVPMIPFNYIPQSPSLDALLRVTQELDGVEGKTFSELAIASKLQKSTIRNIVHDLDQFGIIDIVENKVLIGKHLIDLESKTVLSNIRIVFKRHAVIKILNEYNVSQSATNNDIISYLKKLKPMAQYHIRTWRTYATKMADWLYYLGLIERTSTGIIYKDAGDIQTIKAKRWAGTRRRLAFIGDTSPAKAIDALTMIIERPRSLVSLKKMGFRNATAVLYRFRLIELKSIGEYQISESLTNYSDATEAVWKEAKKEESLKLVIERLQESPSMPSVNIGKMVSENFSRKWKEASCKRIGGGLRQWAIWVMTPCGDNGKIVNPPRRKSNKNKDDLQLTLF